MSTNEAVGVIVTFAEDFCPPADVETLASAQTKVILDIVYGVEVKSEDHPVSRNISAYDSVLSTDAKSVRERMDKRHAHDC